MMDFGASGLIDGAVSLTPEVPGPTEWIFGHCTKTCRNVQASISFLMALSSCQLMHPEDAGPADVLVPSSVDSYRIFWSDWTIP